MQYIIEITDTLGEAVSYFINNYEYLPTLTDNINEAQVFARENSAVQAAYDLSDLHSEYKARAVPINISIADHAIADDTKILMLPKEEEAAQYIVVYFEPVSLVAVDYYALFLPLKEPNTSLSLSQPTHANQPCFVYKNANFFTSKAAAVDFAASIGFFVYEVTDMQKGILDFMYSLDRQIFGDAYPTIQKDVFLYAVGEDSLVG